MNWLPYLAGVAAVAVVAGFGMRTAIGTELGHGSRRRACAALAATGTVLVILVHIAGHEPWLGGIFTGLGIGAFLIAVAIRP